jgi:hypothetical protein
MNTEEISNNFENIDVAYDSRILVSVLVNGKLKIAKVKNGCKELARLCNVTFREANRLEGYFELIKPLTVIIPATVPPRRRRSTLPQVRYVVLSRR